MPSCSLPSRAPALAASPRWEALAADLRERVFGPVGVGSRPRRIGAEVELIPVCAATGRMVPILADEGPASLAVLRSHAARAGWEEGRTPGGAPLFLPPSGGVISYEPGGQIEFSSPACASVAALVRALHDVVLPLRRAAREHGVELLSVGIHPGGPVEEVPLQLGTERYLAMNAFFARRGPAGERMMRQTASFQVNLDWEDDPLPGWRVLNAAAPLLLAAFANSPLYCGVPTGAKSFRARQWRELDPWRTGLLGGAADPVEEYLAFALGAEAVLLRPDEPPRPFAAWWESDAVSLEDWWLHLTTLFPEVRPKGFAEVRSIDALAPEWYCVPPVLLAGLVHDPATLRDAVELLGAPDPELLVLAGEAGLADPRLAGRTIDLFDLALRGAAGLEPFVDGASLERAREFFARYTLRGLSPADEQLAAGERRSA